MRSKINIFLGFCVFIAVIAFCAQAEASGDDLTNVSKNVLTGGDTSIGGNKSLALSGADIDINDYYRSYSYLFGLIQETKSNPLAVARDLVLEGNYEAAAFLRCQPWGVHKAFGGKKKCIKMLSNMEPPEPSSADKDEDDEDERRENDLRALQARLDAFEAKAADDAKKPPKVVQRTVIEQKPLFTDEKLAALRAIRDEK